VEQEWELHIVRGLVVILGTLNRSLMSLSGDMLRAIFLYIF